MGGGSNYPSITSVKGIGQHFGKELTNAGYNTTYDLGTTDAYIISNEIDDISPNQVRSWQDNLIYENN